MDFMFSVACKNSRPAFRSGLESPCLHHLHLEVDVIDAIKKGAGERGMAYTVGCRVNGILASSAINISDPNSWERTVT